MIYIESQHGYTSDKKAERRRIYQNLIATIQERGSKLVPVPKEALFHFDKDPRRIYRVHDLNKTSFGKAVQDLDPDAEFYGARMFGYCGVKRIRKFAWFRANGKQYLLFQQSVDYNNTMSLLDVEGETRYKIRNLRQLKVLTKILSASLEQIPLLINDPETNLNKQLKKMLLERLGY
jgi:hypothetical protein